MSRIEQLLPGAEAAGRFMRLWATGVVNPTRAFDELKSEPAPSWGLAAVTTRFVVTSLTETVPLRMLRRKPFVRSWLPFLSTRDYYAAQQFFLPAHGLAMWLLMSGLGYGALRWKGQSVRLDVMLNVVGMGMLVPMPALWLWDWTMIATDRYRLPQMAVSHALVELWEAMLFGVGLHRLLGVRKAPALGLGVAMGTLYSTLSAVVAR